MENAPPRLWNPLRWPLYPQILVALCIGAALGLSLGPQVAPLGVLAKWIIELIKLLAIPLLFLAILDGVLSHAFAVRGVGALFAISAGNATGAILIALVVSNVFRPGQWLDLRHALPPSAKAMPAVDTSPGHIAALLLGSPMVLAILLALAVGILVWLLQRVELGKRATAPLSGWVAAGLKLAMRLMGWVVRLTPLAVFGAVAKVLGEHGLSMMGGLAAYVGFCVLGMGLHVLLVYHTWVVLVARIPLQRFWKAAREPVVYGFGINSSLATLPVTLQALEDLKVSPGAARLSACVGTNFNNDGILLYEVVAVLFLAQAYGIELSVASQLGAAVVAVAATIGVGGIPEAGIISLSLVLGALHLPAEAIPLLLTVDWVVARCRSAVNVLGDMSVAVAIDAVRGKDAAVAVQEGDAA
jgi:Na+/H+-dicarboxylate symporter